MLALWVGPLLLFEGLRVSCVLSSLLRVDWIRLMGLGWMVYFVLLFDFGF